MTRQELIRRLVRKERKTLVYTFAQITAAIASMSPAEQTSFTDAINAEDKALIADVLFTFMDNHMDAAALAVVNSKIVADRIDIDDVAAAIPNVA